jgi:hypothetical protein
MVSMYWCPYPRTPALEPCLRASNASRSISSVHVIIDGHLNPNVHTRPLINGLETTLMVQALDERRRLLARMKD